MTGSEIVGRDEERASVAAFVGRVPDTPSALVLEGEAGIGKSTLWLEGVDLARARGLRVLSSRPAEAERALVHVGLGDLLEDVLDEALPTLAAPRRSALEVAMLRTRRLGRPCGSSCRRPRGARCAPAARRARSRSWSPSMTCSGSMRPRRPRSPSRCAGSRPAMSWCCSPGGRPTNRSPSRLEDALPPAQVRRVPVGPLSVGALHRLLRDRLGTSFAPADLAPDPGAVGREPVLRDGTGPGPGYGPQPVWTRSRSRRPSRSCWAPGSPGCPARPSRRLAFVAALGTLPESMLAAVGDRGRRHPTRSRSPRDRADRRDDPVHPPAPGVGRVPRPRRAAGGECTRRSLDWPRTPWSVPVTLPCRRTSRMPRSQPCSTRR